MVQVVIQFGHADAVAHPGTFNVGVAVVVFEIQACDSFVVVVVSFIIKAQLLDIEGLVFVDFFFFLSFADDGDVA